MLLSSSLAQISLNPWNIADSFFSFSHMLVHEISISNTCAFRQKKDIRKEKGETEAVTIMGVFASCWVFVYM